jgi:casein kinase 1
MMLLPLVPTRRDDLEAAALMFIHLLTPNGLHWTRKGVPKTDDEHDRLKREKKNARPEDLCRGMPHEFEEFLRYSRKLRFADRPDYSRWVEEFRALMEDNGMGNDEKFVWPPAPVPAVRRLLLYGSPYLTSYVARPVLLHSLLCTAAHQHR